VAAGVLGLLTLATGVIGRWAVLSGFVPYDDEGEFLLTLRTIAGGGTLYEDV
jgi:hypothetical protein